MFNRVNRFFASLLKGKKPSRYDVTVLKNKNGQSEATAEQDTSVRNEISEYDKKYYDLYLKGLIPAGIYEETRLLFLLCDDA